MKILIESAGEVASRVRIGAHQLTFDQPLAVSGGNGRGPAPLELLIASLGACAHYYAAAYLHARGLATDALTVAVEADKEPGPPGHLGRIALTVSVPDHLTSHQVERIEWAVKHSPAYATFAHSPALVLTIQRIPSASQETSQPDAAIGWIAPDRQLDAETARRAILLQHDKIRLLLSRARAIADAALDDRPLTPDAVASVIGDLRSTMEVHLTFEERVLVPLLDRDPPLGPQRAEKVREEHRQQRTMLAAIHREACAHPELPTLAAKLAYLTAWLLTDMNEEEQTILVPEVVRDDSVSVDQNSG